MDKNELIELFFNRTYEKFVNKKILDDKNYIVPRQQLVSYVHELINIPYFDFISHIKETVRNVTIIGADITQFSSFEACEIGMCEALVWANNPGCQFIDIGRMFPQYVHTRNDAAYRKYGENHIKTATQLGLTFEYYEYWYLSCLGYIYSSLNSDERNKLLARTLIRNPLYQQMILDILVHDISAITYMNMLSDTTRLRRQNNVCSLFKICIYECYREGIVIHKLIEDSQKKNNNLIDKIPHIRSTKNLDICRFEEKGPLPNSEILEFVRRAQDDDIDALTLLIQKYTKRIKQITKPHEQQFHCSEDLFQEGVIGLILAVRKYKYYTDFNFNDLAFYYINNSITNSLGNYKNLFRIPPRPFFFQSLINEFRRKYYQTNEFEPPFHDVEIDTDVSSEYLEAIYELCATFDNSLECHDYEDCVADDSYSPDWNLIKGSERYEILRIVYSLKDRERDILVYSFGLNGKEAKTLEEIGDLFGLTRERVRQIREKAIKRLHIFLKVIKDKDIEEDSAIKLIEKRWKRFRGSQFDSVECIYPEEKQLNKAQKSVESDSKREKLYNNANRKSSKTYDQLKESINTYHSDESSLISDNARDTLLKILQDNKRPMTLQEIHTEANNKYFNWAVRIETIEYLLTKMREVRCMLDGRFQLVSVSKRFSLKGNKQIHASDIHKPLMSERDDRKTLKSDTKNYLLYTQEKTAIQIPPNTPDDIFNKYTQIILNMHQAIVKGKVVLAKPVLLLATISGIDCGVFRDNRIFLNDWLEEQYNMLMRVYNNSRTENLTNISMPFWYMKNDKFWHLHYIEMPHEMPYSPSRKWLNKNVEYAYFDDELWSLLSDKTWCERLMNFIYLNKIN